MGVCTRLSDHTDGVYVIHNYEYLINMKSSHENHYKNKAFSSINHVQAPLSEH